MSAPVFDIVIVGGGIAGSALGGVLARAGLGVLVIEREARFRDRIRGEGTWPWGVDEAYRAGLGGVLERAGRVEIQEIRRIEYRELVRTTTWEDQKLIGFFHPRLQEELFTWAGSQGADTIRPAKATVATRHGRTAVTAVQNGSEVEYAARIVVGADGKRSGVRRWIGAKSV